MLNDLGYLMKTWYKIFAKVLNFRDGYKGQDFFPAAFKRPAHDMDTAKKLAKGVNHGICKQVAESPDDTLSQEVWKQTQEELEKVGHGWIAIAT